LRGNAALLLLFLLVLSLENVLTILPLHVEGLRWFGNRYDWQGFAYANWEGKAYAIVMAVVGMAGVMRSRLLRREELGLTIQQQAGSVRPVAVLSVIMLVPVLWLALISSEGPFDGELLLYLLLMPGLSEELVYRGVMLGSADAIAPPRWRFAGASIGWGLIVVSCVFGVLHGFTIGPGWQVEWDFVAVIVATVFGFAFGWMKERTGSLLAPIMLHGLADFLGFFGRMI
jgi:membrane protease YdiL (CAAX protease family)